MTSGPFGLCSSLKHRRDLHKSFSRNRRCYCLRGGLKLANCFGPWDNLALEVPPDSPNSSHVCDHNFLVNDLKQLANRRSFWKQPSRRNDCSLSLNYLSRSGRSANDGSSVRFHHFDSVHEHIKHYRKHKPNSLHSPATENAQESAEDSAREDEQCPHCSQDSSNSPRPNHTDPPPTPSRSQHKPTPPSQPPPCHHHHHHPCSFPLRALGKAIVPSYASLIMRLPSVHDTYWVPVNAVLQKKVPNAVVYYDQKCDGSDGRNVFPSLRMKAYKDTSESPRKRSKSVVRRAMRGGVKLFKEDRIEEEPEEEEEEEAADIDTDPGVAKEANIPSSLTPGMMANKFTTGPGRLLSGQLKSNSVHPDNLQDMVIGIQKSPYERLLPKLSVSSHAKKLNQKVVHTKSSNTVESEAAAIQASISVDEAHTTNKNADDEVNLPAPNEEELTLNKLNITCENSDLEGLIVKSTAIGTPLLELRPASAAVVSSVQDNSDISNQENVYKPKNVAITFTKPKKLFRLNSTHARILQQNQPKSQQDSGKSKDKELQFTAQRGEYHTTPHAKHRLILNRKESGSSRTSQGVFGVQNHRTMRCVLRSQERRKLKLESKSLERDVPGSRRKVQVYLIKTRRSLESILPKLISENYRPESSKASIDFQDE